MNDLIYLTLQRPDFSAAYAAVNLQAFTSSCIFSFSAAYAAVNKDGRRLGEREDFSAAYAAVNRLGESQ